MTSPVCCASGTPRRRRSIAPHRRFSARHTCSAVTAGFFPPQPLGVHRHEPEHHQGQEQVPEQPGVVPALVVHQPGLLFPEPEGVLDRGPAERHRQHPGDRLLGGVGQEVLDLGRRLVDGRQQGVPPSGGPHGRRRHPPHRRPDRPAGDPVAAPGPRVGRGQPGGGPLRPAARGLADREVDRHLGHEPAARQVEDAEHRDGRTIPLVEHQPVGPHPVLLQSGQLVQGDPPLRPVADAVGDAGRPAPLPVCVPLLRQVQVGVEQGLERPPRYPDVDGHDPVVELADAPEVLPLDPGRVAAPLAGAGLVNHPDGPERVGREGGEHLAQVPLEGGAGLVMVPLGGGQELLEGADGRAGGQGERLDRLPREVGQEPTAVGAEVGGGAGLAEAPAEPPEVRGEGRPEGGNLLIGHRYPSR